VTVWRAVAIASLKLCGESAPVDSQKPNLERLRDQAVIDQIDRFADWSSSLNIEFAGGVCRRRNDSLFAPPLSLSSTFDQSLLASCAAANSTPVARFHTRGPYGDLAPSPTDLAAADAEPRIAFYALTPCGAVLRWQGPDAVRNIVTLRPCQR
jgi:hypothetical protein